MLNREFFFWICGYFELAGNKQLTQRQWEIVKNHFKLMLKVTKHRPSIVAINLNNDLYLAGLCFSQIENCRPTEAEIMYYIQGFYEISAFTGKLNKNQTKKIIDLFMENNLGISPTGVEIFVTIGNGKDPRKMLNEIFLHDIDNSYGLSPEEMIETAKIHSGH